MNILNHGDEIKDRPSDSGLNCSRIGRQIAAFQDNGADIGAGFNHLLSDGNHFLFNPMHRMV